MGIVNCQLAVMRDAAELENYGLELREHVFIHKLINYKRNKQQWKDLTICDE
jgi:hypothetical protein